MDKSKVFSICRQFLTENNFPQNLPDYDSQAYWDARYEMQREQVYDWYIEPNQLKDILCQLLSPNMRIMQLGSGKSAMIDSLHKWGYQKLIGSDFSWNLINHRRRTEKNLRRLGVQWQRVDIAQQWTNFKVDCIIQKATLDCLLPENLKITIQHIRNKLQKGGLFIHISSAKPENRISLLKNWDVQVYELPKTTLPIFKQIDDIPSYYGYFCIR